jgi:hypothetical protein
MDTNREIVLIINRINAILDHVTVTTDKLLNIFKDKPQENDTLIFCLTMLYRLNCTATGIKPVIQNFYAQPNSTEYCAGIIMRASVLDHIIIISAQALTDNDNEREVKLKEIDHFCLGQITESVKKTVDYFNKRNPESSDPQKKKKLKQIRAGNSFLFKTNFNGERTGVYRYDDKFLSYDALILKLRKSESYRDYIPEVDELYTYYSKYDHFGYMSFTLNNQELLSQLINLEATFQTMPLSIISLIAILSLIYKSEDSTAILRETGDLAHRLKDERMVLINQVKQFIK